MRCQLVCNKPFSHASVIYFVAETSVSSKSCILSTANLDFSWSMFGMEPSLRCGDVSFTLLRMSLERELSERMLFLEGLWRQNHHASDKDKEFVCVWFGQGAVVS